MDKSFQVQHPDQLRYLEAIHKAKGCFRGISGRSIPQTDNHQVDALAKAATGGGDMPLGAFFEVLHHPTACTPDEVAATVLPIEAPNWRAPLLSFLSGAEEPNIPVALCRTEHRARSYLLVDGALYKAGVCAPLLYYVTKQEGAALIQEIHEGSAAII